MQHTLVTLCLNNHCLKVIAVVIAFFYWSLLSDYYAIEKNVTVPFFIKDGSALRHGNPSHIVVTLQGARKHIRSLNHPSLKAIVDQLELQDKPIIIKNNHLSVPPVIKVTGHSPINLEASDDVLKPSDIQANQQVQQ